MKTIHKYPLEISDKQTIKMPSGAKVVAIQCQNDIPCIWAEVETDNPMMNRRIHIFGTGGPIETENLKYLGTVQQYGGGLVWHIFQAL